MGTIYSAPKGYDPPDLGPYLKKGKNIRDYTKACNNYLKRLKKWAKDKHGLFCKEAGEDIRFQVADGYAVYVVVSLKPVKLIHASIDDGYQFQYVHRLTAKDIREQIQKHKALTELFSSKK